MDSGCGAISILKTSRRTWAEDVNSSLLFEKGKAYLVCTSCLQMCKTQQHREQWQLKNNIKASLTSYLKFEFNNYENLSQTSAQTVHEKCKLNQNIVIAVRNKILHSCTLKRPRCDLFTIREECFKEGVRTPSYIKVSRCSFWIILASSGQGRKGGLPPKT